MSSRIACGLLFGFFLFNCRFAFVYLLFTNGGDWLLDLLPNRIGGLPGFGLVVVGVVGFEGRGVVVGESAEVVAGGPVEVEAGWDGGAGVVGLVG